MKLVKTFGRGKAAADALIETLERRGAVNTARVEPVVRKILAAVRGGGDRALEKYAVQFDGLAKGQGCWSRGRRCRWRGRRRLLRCRRR